MCSYPEADWASATPATFHLDIIGRPNHNKSE